MNKTKRIITSFLAMMLMIVSVFAAFPLNASAMTEKFTEQVSFGGTSNAASQCVYIYYQNVIHLAENCTPQTANAAVYNKSSKGNTLYLLVFRFKAKKKAHVKISYTIGGKYYTNDVYVTPNEYKNPAKSVYIGKQLYFTGNTWAIAYNRKLNGKLKITPKKGWEVYSIYKLNVKDFYTKKPVFFKNNSNIKVNKNERLLIFFRNKKTGKMYHMMHDCYFSHVLG